jgi:alpha-tubulin suppressor-like RCC1 family protein
LLLALSCGARSGLDPSLLELQTGGSPSDGGAVSGGSSSVGGRNIGGAASAGTASGGGSIAGSLAMGGNSSAGTGIVTSGEGGVAGSPEAGAAGEPSVGGQPPEPVVVAMTTGAFHSCARFDDGSLRCWGAKSLMGAVLGGLGAIGDDEPASSVPDVVIGGHVTDFSASWYHTCAILDGGALRCFGNDDGRLGYGKSYDDIGDDETPASVGNVPVGGEVVQVATCPDHTCAVLRGGNVRCWGRNAYSQLGYPNPETIGDDEPASSAPFVDVGGPVKQLSCGWFHTCALLESGKVRCWGRNNGGTLGYGSSEMIGDDETPASAGDVDVGGTVTQIASGMLHTCALLDTGKLRCWGRGDFSSLGYGNLEHIGDDETPASAGDVDVGGQVTRVSAGAYATCALLEGGRVRCWGHGENGELGLGNVEDIGDDEAPGSVPFVNVGGVVRQLSVGFLHVCATLQSGRVRCWGRASTGALGYGNANDIGDDELPADAGDVPAH